MRVEAREFTAFMVEHYEPGFKPANGETLFPCRICASLIVDSGDALERHAKWHEAQDAKIRAAAYTTNGVGGFL